MTKNEPDKLIPAQIPLLDDVASDTGVADRSSSGRPSDLSFQQDHIKEQAARVVESLVSTYSTKMLRRLRDDLSLILDEIETQDSYGPRN